MLPDGLELHFERGSVAHEDAASLERHVPVQTEVFPIELGHRCKASDRLAEWVGAKAVERDIERDLACLSADREIAGDLEVFPRARDAAALEGHRGMVGDVEKVGR